MTSKEALETLNKYRNQNYNSTDKDEVELANAINVILPKYVKQEKLLELYKELATVRDNMLYCYEAVDFIAYNTMEKKEKNLEKQIKELEKRRSIEEMKQRVRVNQKEKYEESK